MTVTYLLVADSSWGICGKTWQLELGIMVDVYNTENKRYICNLVLLIV